MTRIKKPTRPPFALLPLFLALMPALACAYTPDAEYNAQPGLAAIKAGAAYDLGLTGAGIRIGVVDTGINPAHEAFAAAIAAGYNFRTSSDVLNDTGINHGSHIAGVAAARRDGRGMMGVAYGAELVVAATDMSSTQLAAGINFAVSNGARIINNSWGYAGSTILDYSAASIASSVPDLLSALQNAVAADAIVVFSNGNDALLQPQFLGGLPYYFPELKSNWITVAASTNDAKYFSPYSNQCGVAAAWCVLAPGGYSGYDSGVNSVDGSGTSAYVRRYGSSEATAMVSGALALLAERFPYMTGEQLTGVLLTSATHGIDATLSTLYGRGEVDLAKAVKGPVALEFDYDVNVTVDDVWSNNLIGSGALIKRGESTLELSGSNGFFKGGMTVAEGRLRIAADNNLGAVTSALTLDGGVLAISADVNSARAFIVSGSSGGVDTGAFRLTFTGNLTGAGVLEKTGSGTLALLGSSTFSGSTHIQAGTLETAAEHFSGDVVNNATLVFTQALDGIYSGLLSGSGSFIKQGAADLQLSGNNSFSGSMKVEEGSLTGSSASLSSAIVNNAAVIFAQADDGEYVAVMTGSGSLKKAGNGTLLLSGANSYGGGTEVEAGVLEGDVTSLQGVFSGAGTLRFNQSSNAHFAGQLQALAALEKTGNGTLYLDAAGNTATTTAVSAGLLVLPSGLNSNVQLAGGALAAPGGLQGNLVLADKGRLLAGGDAGQPVITGGLEVQSGARLSLQLPALDAGALVQVSGPVQLQGGTVEVDASAVVALSRRVLLHSDSALQGQFDALLMTTDQLRGFLHYEDNSAALVLARNDAFLSSRAQDRNSQAAAKALESTLASGFYSDVFADSVNALSSATPENLQALSGEVAADVGPALMRLLDGAVFNGMGQSMEAAANPSNFLRQSPATFSYMASSAAQNATTATGPHVWIYGQGRRGEVAPDAGSGYGYEQLLWSAGADAELGSSLRLGVMLAQGSQSLNRDAAADGADSELLAGGLYLRYGHSKMELAAALSGGKVDSDSHRMLATGGEAVASSSAQLLAVDMLMRYRWQQQSLWQLNPLLALNWTQLHTPAYTESAPGMLGLSYAEATQQTQILSAGVEFLPAALWLPENFSAQASLLWRHDFSGAEDYRLNASYTQLPGSVFEIRPSLPGADTARLSLGIAYAFRSGLQLGLQAVLEAGSGFSSTGGTLGLDWQW